MVGVKPAIAQLVEHLTVDLAEIRWSLVLIPGGRTCLTPYVDQKHKPPVRFEPTTSRLLCRCSTN